MSEEVNFEAASISDLLRTATNLELIGGLKVLLRMSNHNLVKLTGSGETLPVKDLQLELLKQLESNLSKEDEDEITLSGICEKCNKYVEGELPATVQNLMFEKAGAVRALCPDCGFGHVRMSIKEKV